jgi:hypothetical protein
MVVRAYRQRLASTVCAIRKTGDRSNSCCVHRSTERYDVSSTSETIRQIVTALGYLDDVEEDDVLPIGKAELAGWWSTRQARLARHLSRNPI